MFSRTTIRKVFASKEGKGAAARVAREHGWTRSHVSQWLSGKRESPAVHAACSAEAERLMRGGR